MKGETMKVPEHTAATITYKPDRATMEERGQGYCGLTNFIDQLAIFCEKFYTPPLAGEITHVQCAEKTPKKNAQA